MWYSLLIASLLYGACAFSAADKSIIRVGHFPNITHAQALVGQQLSRQGKGWFEERLGPNVEIQWYVYAAGPQAMEGIFTESIDLVYIGPSPTINAYVKSKALKIISGSCSGGSALVVHRDGNLKSNADFKGKKIGTPQFGNSQDIVAREWLRSIGLRITQTGGDALVIPTDPAEQLHLFRSGELDAVWTTEPWVSDLVLNGNGAVYLEESALWPQTKGRYVATHLVCSNKFRETHPDLVKKWVMAHVELTEWIQGHKEDTKILISQELKKEIYRTLPDNVLDRALQHVTFTYDPIPESLYKYAQMAFNLGFLKHEPDLSGIYEFSYLNEVLKEKGLKGIGN